MKLSDPIGDLKGRPAELLVDWCLAELRRRAAGTELGVHVGRIDGRYMTQDREELFGDFAGPDAIPSPATSAVMVLVAAVWEHAFDVWADVHPDTGAEAARAAAAARAQRQVITAVWRQLALIASASGDAADVVADLADDWPSDGEDTAGAGWAGLLAAAEAAVR